MNKTRSSQTRLTHAARTALMLFAAVAITVTPRQSSAQSCGADGYLLAVSSPILTAADSAYLQSVAHALAYRWPVPRELHAVAPRPEAHAAARAAVGR